MRKLYEILKVLKVQKRIFSEETIRGNTVYEIFKLLWIQKRIVAAATIWGNTVYELNYQLRNCLVFFTFKKTSVDLKRTGLSKNVQYAF